MMTNHQFGRDKPPLQENIKLCIKSYLDLGRYCSKLSGNKERAGMTCSVLRQQERNLSNSMRPLKFKETDTKYN